MRSKSTGFTLFAVLALAAILSGCAAATAAPAPTAAAVPATSTTAPTLDLQPTLNAVRTQAAQTVVAALTQNAPTAAPLLPSSTPAPSATLAPTIPPVPPTATYIPWTLTPSISSTPVSFACTVTSMTPNATTSVAPGTTFSAIWVVKNTGAATWVSSDADIRYVTGTKLQTGGDILDLATNVANGQSYTVTIPMKAPATAATYYETWNFEQSNVTFCKLDLTLLVK